MMQVLPTEILDSVNSNDFNLFFFYNNHVHNKGTKEKVTITRH